MFGGIDEAMTWKEYLSMFTPAFRVKLESVKEYLDSHPETQGLIGPEYQNGPMWEKVKELCGDTFSLRAWGDLMASYMNTKSGEKKYNYTSFAWGKEY